MLSRLRAHVPLWRRALRRRRRLLTALVVAMLLAALLPTVLPPSARGVEVVVSAMPLDAGTVLASDHLRTVRVAPELVPEGTPHQADQILGRTLRHSLPAGSPLWDALLEDPGGPSIPDGSVLMIVPVPDVLSPHLRPGTRIELLSTDPTRFAGSSVPAEVVEVIAPGSSSVELGGGEGTPQAVVTVRRDRSGEVAHALGVGGVVVSVIG